MDAAHGLFDLALSWGSLGRLGSRRAPLTKAQRVFYDEAQVKRLARFDVKGLLAKRRVWARWECWCRANGEDPLQPSEIAAGAFCSGHSDRPATPGQLWAGLAWLAKYLGLPVPLPQDDRPPPTSKSGKAVELTQAPPADPCIIHALEEWLGRERRPGPLTGVVLGVLVGWLACLRFAHIQRSIPLWISDVALGGWCFKGKGKAGYRWSMPRFGLSGLDIGMMVWSSWQDSCRRAGHQLQCLIMDTAARGEQPVPFDTASFNAALPQAFALVGVSNASEASSYSLRRGLTTVADIIGLQPYDRLAVADHQGAPGSAGDRMSSLPLRYAGDKEATAQVIKVQVIATLRAIIGACGEAVTWPVLRRALLENPFAAHQAEAIRAVTAAAMTATLPVADWPKQLRPARSFAFVGRRLRAAKRPRAEPELPSEAPESQLAKVDASSSSSAPAPAGTPQDVRPPGWVNLQSVLWALPAHQAARIHFVDSEQVPWCRAKCGAPFRTCAGAGSGIQPALGIGVPFCDRCFDRLIDAQRSEVATAMLRRA